MEKVIKNNFSIVIVADFVPEIFTPQWLCGENIIEDMSTISIKVISPEFSLVMVRDLVALNIEKGRLICSTSDVREEEYVLEIILRLLKVCKCVSLTALGLNIDCIRDLGQQDKRDKIGFMIAPQTPWSFVDDARMLKLTMESKSNMSDKLSIRTTVEPVSGNKSTVHVQINNHFNLSSGFDNGEKKLDFITDFLENKFAELRDKSTDIIKSVFLLGSE